MSETGSEITLTCKLSNPFGAIFCELLNNILLKSHSFPINIGLLSKVDSYFVICIKSKFVDPFIEQIWHKWVNDLLIIMIMLIIDRVESGASPPSDFQACLADSIYKLESYPTSK